MAMIVIFGFSSVLALLLVMLKYFELRKGKNGFVLRFISRFDSVAEKFVTDVKFRILQTIQTIRYVFLVHIPAIVDRAIEQIKEMVLRELNSRRNMLMGQKDIANKGAVSFFLKKIDENKRNGDKGEINEIL